MLGSRREACQGWGKGVSYAVCQTSFRGSVTSPFFPTPIINPENYYFKDRKQIPFQGFGPKISTLNLYLEPLGLSLGFELF